jgi:hypothetical protein
MPLAALFIFLVVVLGGCSESVPDAQWVETVPGKYEGVAKDFREVLDLRVGGKYRHQVFIKNSLALDESGRWSYEVRRGVITLLPFTSFFDNKSLSAKTNGLLCYADMIAVIRYGDRARFLSFSPDSTYLLMRKEGKRE